MFPSFILCALANNKSDTGLLHAAIQNVLSTKSDTGLLRVILSTRPYMELNYLFC